ncbi:class I SAM-dependent methyltransferase [Leptospira sp. GIMC2001]|uniref:class I SAM-dependent methyltransferase n=1 Tax=Leptospira sp. GIMC2001 TaxID=1513297 RepID=UPI00234BD15A|nr:class I SAM-dependent methyltransferase [Leptospira sp. GIMC2001]WCL48867.1 class I SAM-dependent methyltransferase [Leptospira sp. GIMC2001]
MVENRSPFQGLINVIYFNWHYYLILIIMLIAIYITNFIFQFIDNSDLILLTCILASPVVVSLAVTFYVYDLSDLYELNWLENKNITENSKILIVHAGLDEISQSIEKKFPEAIVEVCDFYDPNLHTEISIRRARKRYPPNPKTISISSRNIPFSNQSMDVILVFLSAHEIRNNKERIDFLMELRRVLKRDGRIYLTEHLRDIPNFIAYTIGFLHFHSRDTWRNNFLTSDLSLIQEIKNTIFISTFILGKNAN